MSVRGIVDAIVEFHRRPTGYQRDESFTRARILRRYAIACALGALLCVGLGARMWNTHGAEMAVHFISTTLGGCLSLIAVSGLWGALGVLLFDLALLSVGILGRRYFLARLAGYAAIALWFVIGVGVAGADV